MLLLQVANHRTLMGIYTLQHFLKQLLNLLRSHRLKSMHDLPAVLGCRSPADKSNIWDIFVEFTLHRCDPLATVVVDLILKVDNQIVLVLLLHLRIPIRIFRLLTPYPYRCLLLQRTASICLLLRSCFVFLFFWHCRCAAGHGKSVPDGVHSSGLALGPTHRKRRLLFELFTSHRNRARNVDALLRGFLLPLPLPVNEIYVPAVVRPLLPLLPHQTLLPLLPLLLLQLLSLGGHIGNIAQVRRFASNLSNENVGLSLL